MWGVLSVLFHRPCTEELLGRAGRARDVGETKILGPLFHEGMAFVNSDGSVRVTGIAWLRVMG